MVEKYEVVGRYSVQSLWKHIGGIPVKLKGPSHQADFAITVEISTTVGNKAESSGLCELQMMTGIKIIDLPTIFNREHTRCDRAYPKLVEDKFIM